MRHLRHPGQVLAFLALSLLVAPEVWAQRAPLPASATTARIEGRAYFFEEAGREMPYEVYVPTSYDAARPTPLIILLHGLGSNPTQVIRYQGLTDLAEERGYIVAAPMGYNERGWYGSMTRPLAGARGAAAGDPPNLGELSEQDVLNVFELMLEEFNVDPDRMYLLGHSMGGAGVLHIGTKNPDAWAAIGAAAPATAAAGMSPDQLDGAHIPVIIIQGTEDNLVNVRSVRPWPERLRELGVPYEYVEIEGGDHTAIIARTPANVEKVFDFFDRHERNPR